MILMETCLLFDSVIPARILSELRVQHTFIAGYGIEVVIIGPEMSLGGMEGEVAFFTITIYCHLGSCREIGLAYPLAELLFHQV